jgi:hypothetical protein
MGAIRQSKLVNLDAFVLEFGLIAKTYWPIKERKIFA